MSIPSLISSRSVPSADSQAVIIRFFNSDCIKKARTRYVSTGHREAPTPKAPSRAQWGALGLDLAYVKFAVSVLPNPMRKKERKEYAEVLECEQVE